jgi:two-component system CheB/CheR fusion protein
MHATQEELRSSNEEMQSTNEEMQSANEELTTSKEEMQSLNEELQIVNSELHGKLDEIYQTNNDMENLFNSTNLAILFLDNDLKVRRFTTQAARIIKFIAGDVGRPVTDLASDLLYPGLPEDAREVIRDLGFKEKSISTRDGCWFKVRIRPYRTLDGRIDGVVIAFQDISTAKTPIGKMQDMQVTLQTRHADASANSDLAMRGVMVQRQCKRQGDGKPPDSAQP